MARSNDPADYRLSEKGPRKTAGTAENLANALI